MNNMWCVNTRDLGSVNDLLRAGHAKTSWAATETGGAVAANPSPGKGFVVCVFYSPQQHGRGDHEILNY